jgi:hypothetical protein
MAFINVKNVATYGILPSNSAVDNSNYWDTMMERDIVDNDIIQFDEGIYVFARTLVVHKQVVITGKWAPNYADQIYTTLAFTQPSTTGIKLLSKSNIMHLKVAGAGGTDIEADGIFMVRNCALENLDIDGFAGTGLFVDASSFLRSLPSSLPTILANTSPAGQRHLCGMIGQTNSGTQHDIISQMIVKLYGFSSITSLSGQLKLANVGSAVLQPLAPQTSRYWRIIKTISDLSMTRVRLTLTGTYGDDGSLLPTDGLIAGGNIDVAGVSPAITGGTIFSIVDGYVLEVDIASSSPHTLATSNNYFCLRNWNSTHTVAYKSGIGFATDPQSSVTNRAGNILTVANVGLFKIGDQILVSGGTLGPVNTLLTIVGKTGDTNGTLTIDSSTTLSGGTTGLATRATVSRPANVVEQAGLDWVRIRETSSDPGRAAFAVGDTVRVTGPGTSITANPTSGTAQITAIVDNTIFLNTNLTVADGSPSNTLIFVTSGLNSIVHPSDFSELIEGVYLTLNHPTDTISDKRISDMRSGFLTVETGSLTAFNSYTSAATTRGCMVTDHNADHSFVQRIRARHCNIGIRTVGDKANTITFIHCDTTANDHEGVLEESFLGNTWIMPHTATNGLVEAITQALWFPGSLQVGSASTAGTAGGTVELVNSSGFSAALVPGTRIWTRDLRAVAASAGATGEHDLAGSTPSHGAVIIWRSADGLRIRYVDDGSESLYNWNPNGIVGTSQLCTRSGNVITTSGSRNPLFVVDAYIELSDGTNFSSNPNPVRITAVGTNTITVDSSASFGAGTSGRVYLRSRFFESVVGAVLWRAPGFHIPSHASSNRSQVFGSYAESDNYAPAINTLSATIFPSAGGSNAILSNGMSIVSTAPGRWFAQNSNLGAHQPGTVGGSTGPTKLSGPYNRICLGFSAEHDNDQEYNLVYNANVGTDNAPYWYAFRHGTKNSASGELVFALGGNHSIDATGDSGSGNNRLWLRTGMYLGAKIVELSGATRVMEHMSPEVTYRCTLFREVTGTRKPEFADDNNSEGYESRALAWGAEVPATATDAADYVNNWNVGDLVLATGLGGGGPAAWICAASGVPGSDAALFGSIWASLSSTLTLGSEGEPVGELIIGNGGTSSSPNDALIRATDSVSNNGAALTIRAGNGSGDGGDLTLCAGSGSNIGGATEVRAGDGVGTNIAGGILILSGGRPTGNGAGGPVTIATAPAGSSGSSLRPASHRFTVATDGEIYHAGQQIAATEGVHRQTFKSTVSAAATVTAWSLPFSADGKVAWIQVSATMRSTSTADGGAATRVACVKRAGGAASLIGAVATILTATDAGMTGSITIDASGTDARVRVTGSSTQTVFVGEISWQIQN